MRAQLLRLSKSDLADLADVCYHASLATTPDDALDVVRALASLVPSEGVLCTLARCDPAKDAFEVHALVQVGWPRAWIAHYREHRCDRADPVLATHYRAFRPQVWSHTYRRAGEEALRFCHRARDFGLDDGLTLGVAGARRGWGSVLSFPGREIARAPRHMVLLEHAAPALHGLLQRLPRGGTPPLTARECEVLACAQAGKTTAGIARTLGISERTVVFHVRNAMRKLAARNRAQAVAKALAHGWLDPWAGAREGDQAREPGV